VTVPASGHVVAEWGFLPHGTGFGRIEEPIAASLAAAAAASPLAGRSGVGVLEHRRDGLAAKGIVGVVSTRGASLEILPKITSAHESVERPTGDADALRARLIHMLSVAFDLRIHPGAMAGLGEQREIVLDLLIRLFAERLSQALRDGLPRRYVRRHEDRPALRGRLDVVRQFSILAAQPHRLACRFDELSADIALNRIMKAAVDRLGRAGRSEATARALRPLQVAYADVSTVPRRQLPWADVVLDRTNTRWRDLLRWAELFLGDRFQTTHLGSGVGVSLLFPMHELFERYCTRRLRAALVDTGLTVRGQGGRRPCLRTVAGVPLFETRPDILVMRGDAVVHIVDTKWKRITSPDDDPKRGISQADVYQMMAYGRIYGCRDVTLLYPHHEDLGCHDGMLASHRVAGTDDHRLHVSTFNVASDADDRTQLCALASGTRLTGVSPAPLLHRQFS